MSVGYYIQPEDHIDILVTPAGKPGVRYAFQDVRVLRVGASTGARRPPATAAVNSYIIELPRNQAEIMTALTTGPGPGRAQVRAAPAGRVGQARRRQRLRQAQLRVATSGPR